MLTVKYCWVPTFNSRLISWQDFPSDQGVILCDVLNNHSVVLGTHFSNFYIYCDCLLLVDCDLFMAIRILSSASRALVSTPCVVTNAVLRISSPMVPVSNRTLASWPFILIVPSLVFVTGRDEVGFHSPDPPCPHQGPTRTHSLDRAPFVTTKFSRRPVFGMVGAGAWAGYRGRECRKRHPAPGCWVGQGGEKCPVRPVTNSILHKPC